MVEGPNIYGEGVNIAARLQELAEAGGVVVSDHPAKTTLPNGLSSIRWRKASPASAKGWIRSTIGLTDPLVISGRASRHAAAIVVGDWANREKPAIRARFQIRSVTSIVVLRPAE
jgi:hypothetical protein